MKAAVTKPVAATTAAPPAPMFDADRAAAAFSSGFTDAEQRDRESLAIEACYQIESTADALLGLIDKDPNDPIAQAQAVTSLTVRIRALNSVIMSVHSGDDDRPLLEMERVVFGVVSCPAVNGPKPLPETASPVAFSVGDIDVLSAALAKIGAVAQLISVDPEAQQRQADSAALIVDLAYPALEMVKAMEVSHG